MPRLAGINGKSWSETSRINSVSFWTSHRAFHFMASTVSLASCLHWAVSTVCQAVIPKCEWALESKWVDINIKIPGTTSQIFWLWYRASGSTPLMNCLGNSDLMLLEFVIHCLNIPDLSISPLLSSCSPFCLDCTFNCLRGVFPELPNLT